MMTDFPRPQPAPDRGDDVVPELSAIAPDPRTVGHSIMIVDDDDGVREVLSQLLEVCNYEVRALSSGAQALEYLQNHSPALAFVDLLMPGIGGAEVLRALQQQRPETRTVVMSGCGVAATREALGGTEPQRLLSKPFGVTEVLQTAQELLC